MFKKIFKELNLPANSLRIFEELVESGASTARHLSIKLDIPRPSIYDNVKVLIERGLVTERSEGGRKVFSIDNIKNIPDLLQTKINSLTVEKAHFQDLLPSLLKRADSIEPKIKFYSGIESLKQVLNHIMLHRDIDTVLMWPISNVIGMFGKEYLAELNKKRINRNISIRAIYPKNAKVNLKENPFLGVGDGHLREVRIAPKEMHWDMGYWMYEDKVGFISSQKEAFGFVVQSRDFTQLLKTQFDQIWKTAKPVKPQPNYTDKFLEGVKKAN